MTPSYLDRVSRASYAGSVADRGEDADLRTELRTLRARVEEQTALTKRTADALRRLAESLVARKRGHEQLLSLNSFAAYALFTILLGGGFYLLYQSRVAELVEGKREATQARDDARERADSLQGELDAIRAGADRAHAFFELVEGGDAPGVLAGYPELDATALTPTEHAVFAKAVQRARVKVAGADREAGFEAFEQGEYARAAAALTKASELEAETERAAMLRYYLGVARFRLGEHEAAARALELALAGRAERQGFTDVRYYFAAAMEELGERDRARGAYERYAADNPASPRAHDARQQASALREPAD